MGRKCDMCEAEIVEGTQVECANCTLCAECGEYAADFACAPGEEAA